MGSKWRGDRDNFTFNRFDASARGTASGVRENVAGCLE